MCHTAYSVQDRQGLESHISTTTMLYLCFLIFLFHGVVDCVVDCHGKDNGNYQITCTGYTTCSNGIGTIHTCAHDQMYNPVTKRCASIINLAPPCAIKHDCSTMPNRRFADLETNCESYYTCQDGLFHGHNFCNPGTVYDEKMQICNWPVNVYKPCGLVDPPVVG